MYPSKDTLWWGFACGVGAALWALMLGGPIFALVMFIPGALIGVWAEQTRYDPFRHDR